MGLFGFNHQKKDDKEHVVMYNKETNEHWSYDRKETVPGWYEIDNLHHTDHSKDEDSGRFDWKDPGRSIDTYGDKDSSDKDDK